MSTTYYSAFHPAENSGTKGSAAFAGSALNTAVIYLYRRSATALTAGDKPNNAANNATTTYTFDPSSINLSSVTNGWTSTIPAGSDPLYVVTITVASDDPTVTITTGEWATPVVLAQNGANGAAGANNAIAYLYQRSATSPAAPTGTFTYTFATGVLSGGIPGSWTQAIPATNGNPLWVIAATASASTATDTIASTEFSSPVTLAADGAAGLNSATVFLYQRAATAPAVPNASTTYTFATGILTGAAIGSWTQTVPAGTDPLYVTTATAAATTATDTILNTEWATVRVLAQNGTNGAAGTPAISGYLTNESVSLFAYANGIVTSYAPATGSFVILSGTTDISTNFTLSTVTNPQALTVTYTNRVYTVSAGLDAAEDTASLTIRATGSGVWAGITIDKVFSLAKTKGGYEIVSSLPGVGDPRRFEGSIVFLTTDDKLYRFEGTNWTSAVPAVDITGQILNAQIADNAVTGAKIVDSAVVSAKIADSAIISAKLADSAVTSAKLVDNAVTSVKLNDLAVTSAKIGAGAVISAKLAIGVGGNMLIGAVPSTNPNKWNTAGYNPDSVTYRNNGFGIFLSYTYGGAAGNEWTLPDNSTFAIYQDNAFSGGAGLADFYPSSLSSVSGAVNIDFPVVVNKTYEFSVFTGAHRCKFGLFMGWLNSSGTFISFTTEDINDDAEKGGTTLSGYKRLISRGTAPAGAVSVRLIYRKYHTKPGQTDSWIFLNRPMFGETVANATEALPYSLPSPGIIHAEQLLNSSIASGQIAANAIISDKIAANAIVSDKIAANAITAGKIAADSITATEIAANAITANEIAANAITAGKIEANAVTADKVAANAITAGKIEANAVTADKVAANAITAGKIEANAVTSDKIAANSITASKIILTNRDALDPDPGFNDPTWWGVAGVGDYVGVTSTTSSQPFRFIRINSGGGLRDYFSSDVPVEQGAFYRTRLRIFISADAAGWFGCTWHWPWQAWYTVAPYTTRGDVDSNAYPVIDMANTTIPKGQWVSYVRTDQFNNTNNGQHYIEHRMRHNLTAGYVEFVWEIVRANNAELIVDGAITATKVAANAITADKIEANAVTAAKIQAGSITANKLLVVPNNLNPDPLFRDESNWILNEPNAWYFEDSTTSAVSIALGYRKYAALWSGASGANIGTGRRHIYSQAIPFNGRNQILRLRGRGWNGSNQDLWLGLEFLNGSGGYISGSYTPGLAAGVGAGDITRQVTVPNNTGFIRVMASNDAPGSTFSGSLAITDIKVDIAASAEMVVDGAITADKVAANAITAAKINANAITADKIEAGAVTAAKIAVTSLSAITADVGTLTAGIIRNTSDTYRVDVTNGRTIVQTGSFMKVSGAPFGSSNQFIEWYGPYFASLSSCTEANATYYLKTNGSAYFGGTLSAGVLKNAAQSTSVASDASITVGDFSSNGGVKTITLSYEYARGYQCNTNTGAITGSSNISVLIEKSTNGGSTWTTLATLTVPDTERTVEVEPPDFDRVQYRASASTTLTDNTGAGNMRLRARLTSRTLPTLSGTGIFNFVETQNISVISIE